MHPFGSDLSQLKDNEVEAKLFELNRKYFVAARLGNRALLTQLATYVTIYKEEMNQRYLSKSKGQMDNDLDQLINVD